MQDLILENKTGFLSTLPFRIVEENGTLFYASDFTDHIARGEELRFNVPAGIYKYDGNFIKLDSPIGTKSIPLPPKERNIAYKRYNIEFGNNPNKCTIFYDKAVILFDSSFLNKPLYIKYGIYYHELGHHWYVTEKYADRFFVFKLLEKGFNPSQIGRAALETLSSKPESYERKRLIVEMLTTNKG